MNATQLLTHFDRLAEAPDAVPRLRRFILDLAVRGDLVAQDADDEPAVELMKRIQSEKARRIKSGELRNPRELEFSDDEKSLFLLPPTWQWIRLADAGAVVGGGTPPSGDSANFTDGGKGIAWLTPADLGKHKGLFISHGARDLTEAGMRAGSATLMPKGSVLFTSRAPIGYVAIAANEIATNQGFKSVVPYLSECSRYIATYLQAFGPWIESKATGTTFKEVSGKIVSGLPFPLPPLAEQHRIVAKVDELMALCDQLEIAQQEREGRRDRAAAASLQRLNQPTAYVTREAQSGAARFHLDHLPRFTTRTEHIKALRETIVNLGISGRLIPQSDSDEPALYLLRRANEEKDALVRAGLLKPEKPVKDLSTNRAAVALPTGWVEASLQDVCISIADGDHLPPPQTESGVPFLVIGNVRNRKLDFTGCRYVPAAYFEALADIRRPRNGDVLYTLVGSYGIPVLVGNVDAFCVQRHIGILRPSSRMSSQYLAHLLRSRLVFDQATECATGIAQKTVPLAGLRAIRVPVPPHTEQQRIVAKIDELNALCDQLEIQLAATQANRSRLMESLFNEALGVTQASAKSDLADRADALVEVQQTGKESRFMTTNPAMTVDQLTECIDDLGGATTPERLLKQTGLTDDVETFYDLLRAARDSGKVAAPLGAGEVIRRHVNAD